jgi:predicted RNase H-like HicB family nuclease
MRDYQPTTMAILGADTVVSVPEIPGAHGQGRTREEAREMIKDATRLLLEVRREDAEREASAAGTSYP